MKKYVVFDIDGTLNETALYAVEAYQKALLKRNRTVDEKTILSCIGLSPDAIIEKLFGSLSEEEYQLWREDILEGEANLMKRKARSFPGIKEALSTLQEMGYELLICSNAYPEHINNVLRAIGLEGYFGSIGSLEMGGTKSKVLQVLLEKLPEGKACMVGDRKFDMEAARYNKIPIIGCGYGYAPKEIAMADKVIASPTELVEAVKALI